MKLGPLGFRIARTLAWVCLAAVISCALLATWLPARNSQFLWTAAIFLASGLWLSATERKQP